MKVQIRTLALILVLALFAAACGGDDTEGADAGGGDAGGEATEAAPEPTTAAPADGTSTPEAGEASETAASDTSDITVPTADSEYQITLIPGVIGDEFYVSMECGAKAAAEQAGVQLDVQGADTFDPPAQIPVLEAVIASEPDAILIAPTDGQALLAPLQEAVDAGITVVLVDTTLGDPSLAVSQISSDNVAGGQQAAETLANLIDEPGSVLVVNVNPGITTTDQRQQGFEEGIQEFDLEYLGAEYSNNEPAQAAQIVSATVAAVPDLRGIFATNLFSAEGSATGLRQADAADQVAIVGFDAGPAQIDQLREGLVQALIAQRPNEIGRLGVAQAVTALNGGEPEAQITTGFESITQENMEEPEKQDAVYQSSC